MIVRCVRCVKFNRYKCNSLISITFSSESIAKPIDANETKLSSLSMFLSLSKDETTSSKYVMHPDLMKSLQTYYIQNKHMKIPKQFVIPHREPWPKELWGYPLGSEFHLVKNIANLERIGINKEDIVITKKEQTKMALDAFRTYKKIYGNLDIKANFIVQPFDNRWPSSMIGYPLGMVKFSVMKGFYRSLHTELDKMGFIWNYAEARYEKMLLAMRTYKKLYGNLHVKTFFVVPNDDTWPKELHNYKLGRLVENIRLKFVKVDAIKNELDELGFIWNLTEYRWKFFEKLLNIFKEVISILII